MTHKPGARNLSGLFEELMPPILTGVPAYAEIGRAEVDPRFDEPRCFRPA